jgi:hypothetical protein
MRNKVSSLYVYQQYMYHYYTYKVHTMCHGLSADSKHVFCLRDDDEQTKIETCRILILIKSDLRRLEPANAQYQTNIYLNLPTYVRMLCMYNNILIPFQQLLLQYLNSTPKPKYV